MKLTPKTLKKKKKKKPKQKTTPSSRTQLHKKPQQSEPKDRT